MKPEDHQEAIRLCEALHQIHASVKESAVASEALKKAALAISLSFAHGLRGNIEALYKSIDEPLSQADKANLELLGISPEYKTEPNQ